MYLRLIAETQTQLKRALINDVIKISIKQTIHDPKIYYLNAEKGRELAADTK